LDKPIPKKPKEVRSGRKTCYFCSLMLLDARSGV